MIPILYEGTETAFTSNGIGRLADAITCKVVEERNGSYELEMTYPVTGVHYADIEENKIILAQPHDGGQTEPFVIYQIEKPLNGICTIKAEHISYRLCNIPIMPFTAGSLSEVMVDLPLYSAVTNNFTFASDMSSTTAFTVDVPTSCRELLGGTEGSVLDTYGGEYEFNRFTVNLHSARGADNGVTLRYGKNITDLKSVVDMTNVYTGICPYWANGEGVTVTLPEKVVMSGHESAYPFNIIKSVDFSSDFEEQPTEAQLRSAAQSYLASNEGWKLGKNITVSFVALWNTEEYANIAPLERVNLCDTVHVVYTPLGVDFTVKVVKTDYDVLQEKYNEITLGETYYTLGQVFSDVIKESEQTQTTHMQKAIAHATELITGGLGGHVVLKTNADGEPEEILIMDTDDIETAVNVLRINLNGIGFSTTGYNGPFTTAWTIDGHFVADFIDTGTLNANIIKAGILSDEDGNTTFNLETGALVSKNLTVDSTYFKLDNTGKITSITEDGRKLEMEKGTITGYKANGDESASLEIGDGYFNIVGQLALNGQVGVSGSTQFVKGLRYDLEFVSQDDVASGYTQGTFLTSLTQLTESTETHYIPVTVSGWVDGQSVTMTGNISFDTKKYTLTPMTQTGYLPTNYSNVIINSSKAVAADTGYIFSNYGLIQSIL